MNIPEGTLNLIIGGVFGFSTKVLFGLIGKNELKSDEADLRLHKEISSVRSEMKEMDTKYRSNDRELYGAIAHLRERITIVEK